MKDKYLKAIESIGIDIKKLRFKYLEHGKYGQPEIWLYKKFLTGEHGTLVTADTIKDKDYLREYLYDFI